MFWNQLKKESMEFTRVHLLKLGMKLIILLNIVLAKMIPKKIYKHYVKTKKTNDINNHKNVVIDTIFLNDIKK